MRCFCTIITSNYIHYALALHDSLLEQNKDAKLAIFISKGELVPSHETEILTREEKVEIYYYSQLKDFGLTSKLNKKYYQDYHDAYRWGMKPVFINFLLQKYEQVVYLDSDLYFYNDYNFIFRELKKYNVLLTPHWRVTDPQYDYFNFLDSFRDGLYNAGFIGASSGAEDAMEWWAQMILFKCEVNRDAGFYVDQRYLDILPVSFKNVKALSHRGCNVANWNMAECRRTPGKEGVVFINNEYPIIFIHYTNTMFAGILFNGDEILLPYLKKYRDNILKYSQIDIIENFLDKGQYKKSRNESNFKEINKNSIRLFLKRFLKKIDKALDK